MANLVRREHIFDDLFDLRRNFDHILNRSLTGSASPSERQAQMLVTVPPIEAGSTKRKRISLGCRYAAWHGPRRDPTHPSRQSPHSER